MESSSRIRTLADLWNHKQPPLTVPQNAIVSPRVHRPSIISTFVTNYSRAWALFLNKPWPRLAELSLAVIISLIIGWVFYDLPRNRRSGIDDREGFLTTMLCLAPTLMAILGQERIFELRSMIEHDRRAGVHSPGAHLIATVLFDLPFAIFASLALGAPAYFLVKLNPYLVESLAALIAFLAPFAVNFLLYRYTGWLFALLADSKLVAAAGTGIIAIINLLLSGFVVHEVDQWHAFGGINLQFWSPTRWIGRDLMDLVWKTGKASSVFNFVLGITNESIAGIKSGFPLPSLVVDCERKPVVATKLRVPVLTVKKCLKTTGTQVMAFFDPNDSVVDLGWIVVASWIATLLIVLWGVAAFCRPKTRVARGVDALRLKRA
uniref:ABC2_membrane domain-containing protein n=1 Tax=Panagrellus redivivus TaxID=6233 RepID=A0A7E4ZVM9_PANRE